MAVFWVVELCSPVEVYHCPDDGGSKDLWNFGELLPDYMALQPRRQPSSMLEDDDDYQRTLQWIQTCFLIPHWLYGMEK
jgi:hypothetical protein